MKEKETSLRKTAKSIGFKFTDIDEEGSLKKTL
jgi:hypothetical protein